jgi:hypothetical protein
MRTKEESRAIQARAMASALVEIGDKYGHDKVITNDNKHEFKARHDKDRAERLRKAEIERMLQQANKEIVQERDHDERATYGYGLGKGRNTGD